MVVKPINDNENQAPECVTTPSPNIKTTTTLVVATIIISLLLISQQQNQQNCNCNNCNSNNKSVDLNTVIINRHLTLDGINSDEALTTTIIKTALKSDNQNPQLNTDKIDCYFDKEKKQITIFPTDTNFYHNIVVINYEISNKFIIISNIDTNLVDFTIDNVGTMYIAGEQNSFNNSFYIKKRNDEVFTKVINTGIKGAIKVLRADKNGNLWVGTHNGDYTGYFYKKNFNSDQFDVIYNNREVRAITVDKENNIYYCYHTRQTRVVERTDVNKDNVVSIGNFGNFVHIMVCDNNNDLYIGGEFQGRGFIDFKRYNNPSDSKVIQFQGDKLLGLVSNDKGNVYAITRVGGNQTKVYQSVADQNFREINTLSGVSQAIAVNNNGVIYVGIGNKLYQKNTGDKDFWEIGSVIGDVVRLAIIDNVLWVGTSVNRDPGKYSSIIYKQELKLVTK